MFWCWSRCFHGIRLSWNLLCNILFLFNQMIWWMMLTLFMSVILPRENLFFLSKCLRISNHLSKKCPCIDVGFCVPLILEEVKLFFRFLNALLVSSLSFYPVEWVLLHHICAQLYLFHPQLFCSRLEGCC